MRLHPRQALLYAKRLMSDQSHWDRVYETKAATDVSWFSPHLEQSLSIIERICPAQTAQIIDVGCGQSSLALDLIERGYHDLTLLDISAMALDRLQQTLSSREELQHQHIKWLHGDVASLVLPTNAYDVWHDRAVLHFATTEQAKHGYATNLKNALKPQGFAIIAVFAQDGPQKCSGLNVCRYSPEDIKNLLGSQFTLLETTEQSHVTPTGAHQSFMHFVLQKTPH